jgi:6-pyruvoyl-tetrahydropterin synthase
VYTASVESRFSATHSVRLPDGSFEAPHAHDWQVRAVFARPGLNADEMVVDFCEAQEALAKAIDPLRGQDLNRIEAFAGRIPTAEVVARFIYDELWRAGLGWLRRVEVTEAPGCVAGYEAAPTDSGRPERSL